MNINKKITDLENSLQELYSNLNNRSKIDYNRSLPFQDSMFNRFKRAETLKFGKKTSIYNSSYVFGDVEVGNNTWIGPNTILDGSGNTLKIGNFCSISSGVQIYTHDTVFWAVSGGKLPFKKGSVTIGDFNYIGSLSIINHGITIGNRCIVAANSFVNCNIPDRSIYAGSPAKKIGEVVLKNNEINLKYDLKKD